MSFVLLLVFHDDANAFGLISWIVYIHDCVLISVHIMLCIRVPYVYSTTTGYYLHFLKFNLVFLVSAQCWQLGALRVLSSDALRLICNPIAKNITSKRFYIIFPFPVKSKSIKNCSRCWKNSWLSGKPGYSFQHYEEKKLPVDFSWTLYYF